MSIYSRIYKYGPKSNEFIQKKVLPKKGVCLIFRKRMRVCWKLLAVFASAVTRSTHATQKSRQSDDYTSTTEFPEIRISAT